MSYNVAIVGATGAVGKKLISTLLDRDFPIKNLYLLASKKSEGKEIILGDKKYVVTSVEKFDFFKADIAFFSAGASVSAKFAIEAEKKNCYVVDNTSYFRMQNDIALIVPEINAHELNFTNRKIIANPNCSTIQMLMALKPIHDINKITKIIVSTYQSASGAGQQAMEELTMQSKDILNKNLIKIEKFPKQIAFNVIPQIDVFEDNGCTKEEMKMVNETKKILDDKIEVNATCVRVPSYIGHAESIYIELEKDMKLINLTKELNIFSGVVFSDTDYHTPIDSSGNDWVYISRVRKDLNKQNAFNLWVVSDNLLKGAALNSVQIGEVLIKKEKVTNDEKKQ